MEIELDTAHTPQEIEQRSFEIIEGEIPEPRPYEGLLWKVARRCIHALGDISILPDLSLNSGALDSGLDAMRHGNEIYADTRMLAAGLVERRMRPLGIKVIPLMELPNLERKAAREKVTRSYAAVKEVASLLNGKIIVIGNAPTALLALLSELERLATSGSPVKPALIVGMPVGFVNAAQSKDLLAASPWPHFTIKGRKGGSPLAAACINAMADIVLEERACGRCHQKFDDNL